MSTVCVSWIQQTHRHSGVAFSDVSQTDSSRVWPTAKDPARQALVTALLHPLPLNTALGLLLEAVMRNAHLVKNSATPRQVKAPKVTLVGIVSQVKGRSQRDSQVKWFVTSRGVLQGVSSSLMNHSCLPNCKVSAVAEAAAQGITTVTVRALRDVAAGEELSITYIGLNQGVRERREMLEKGYGFLCSCKRCAEEEATAA